MPRISDPSPKLVLRCCQGGDVTARCLGCDKAPEVVARARRPEPDPVEPSATEADSSFTYRPRST